ncbi:MAG TPA: hypothetical protein VMM13_20310 [Euzebya sp.]|nr:hypothetical protein [Euzebya sp.]
MTRAVRDGRVAPRTPGSHHVRLEQPRGMVPVHWTGRVWMTPIGHVRELALAL